MKRILIISKTAAILLCTTLMGGVTSCADDYNNDPLTKNTILSSITIDEKYEVYPLLLGESYQLSFTTLPENATNSTVVWISSNEEVATVDANGNVTTVSTGTAIITAKPAVGYDESVVATITINVVEEFTLTQSLSITTPAEDLEMMETQSLQLKTQTTPANPSFYLLDWKSSDESTARVDESGRVLAIKAGKATITATTTDGTNLSDAVEVTVSAIIPVTEFRLSSIHNVLAIGEISVMQYDITPDYASASALTWTSTDDAVVTVGKRILGDEEVLVIVGGARSGSATLTAKIEYTDGTPTFERKFDLIVADGKINDDFLFSEGRFAGGVFGVRENGKLVMKTNYAAGAKCETQFRGTMTFYPSKFPIYAIKTFFGGELEPGTTPTLLLNIWNNNPRISIGFYGGTAASNALNLYSVSMTKTSDGGYVAYADLSTNGIFKGATEGYLTEGVLMDGVTLDRCEHRFYDTYFTEAVTEPFALDWVKTFASLEEYKDYLVKYEGVVF